MPGCNTQVEFRVWGLGFLGWFLCDCAAESGPLSVAGGKALQVQTVLLRTKARHHGVP